MTALTSTQDSSPGSDSPSNEGTHAVVSNFGALATSNWTVDESRSSMDDSRTVTLQLLADGSFSSWANEEHTPSLIIRCKENGTDLYVVNGTAANPELGLFDRATVRLRIDDGKPYSERWSESTDDEALFAPPISLARRLAHAERLTYQFTPFNSSPVTVAFTVKGLDQVLQKVADACSWPTG